MEPEISAHVHRPYLNSETRLSVQVDIEPGTAASAARDEFVVCIDTSISMDSEDKLQKAKAALTDWVFALVDDADAISVVAFDSEPAVVFELTEWADLDREDAEEAIEALSAGGQTDMYGALETAADMLRGQDGDGPVAKRILLLSDGKQNAPEKGDAAFERLASRIDDCGIRVRAGGIGTDYDEAVIKALGTTARGKWIHVQNPREIRDFFGTAVEEAQTVIGTDAELRFDFHPEVEVNEAFRAYPQVHQADVERDGAVASVQLPDLRERAGQQVAMELQVPDAALGTVTLADVELRVRGETWAESPLEATYTDDTARLGQVNEAVDLHLQKTRIRSALGDGNVDTAQTVLEETKLVHGETNVGDVEQAVTRVEEHDDAAARNRTTLVGDRVESGERGS